MRRTSANRLLFAGLVAPLGVLVAAVVTTVYLELSVIIQLAIMVGLIAAVVAIDRVRWLPDPCLPPFRDQEPQVEREVAATRTG